VTKGLRMLFGGGCKYYEKVQNHGNMAISGMFCMSTGRDCVTPMTLYKSTTGCMYQSWCEGSPDGASKSGWFDMEEFTLWFKQVRV
jgi:hypothetical protein